MYRGGAASFNRALKFYRGTEGERGVDFFFSDLLLEITQRDDFLFFLYSKYTHNRSIEFSFFLRFFNLFFHVSSQNINYRYSIINNNFKEKIQFLKTSSEFVDHRPFLQPECLLSLQKKKNNYFRATRQKIRNKKKKKINHGERH